MQIRPAQPSREKNLANYKVTARSLVVNVDITKREGEFVPIYTITLVTIGPTTRIILDKLREEFLLMTESGESKVYSGIEPDQIGTVIREEFKDKIAKLLEKYFPGIDFVTKETLLTYMVQQNLGLGNIELLLADSNLEEIVINGHDDPVWVYHKQFGWLKTNVTVPQERLIRHYSTLIGREVGKDITLLTPLMDASLTTGDRVNATLRPISSHGNTITIRKFAAKPWTVIDLIKNKTLPIEAAAFVWLAAQFELSTLIVGGTGSGKTSMLNVVANFFPPNQRIVSIEDTRELTLPQTLHWVPLQTRAPNPEGKGGVSMLDLVVNSLRMRPDRILVGEIRRKAEAEVLFEAMHTGHSVCATLHANDADETIARLTNPPIEMPKGVLPALSLMLVQYRNRRTNTRRTLQLAEVNEKGDANVFYQHDAQKDILRKVGEPKTIMKRLNLFSGMSEKELERDLKNKQDVLAAMAKMPELSVDQIGYIMSQYYTKGEAFSAQRIPEYLREFALRKRRP